MIHGGLHDLVEDTLQLNELDGPVCPVHINDKLQHDFISLWPVCSEQLQPLSRQQLNPSASCSLFLESRILSRDQ